MRWEGRTHAVALNVGYLEIRGQVLRDRGLAAASRASNQPDVVKLGREFTLDVLGVGVGGRDVRDDGLRLGGHGGGDAGRQARRRNWPLPAHLSAHVARRSVVREHYVMVDVGVFSKDGANRGRVARDDCRITE